MFESKEFLHRLLFCMQFFILYLLSLISSSVLIFCVRFLFLKYKFLDNPVKYWLKRKPIPYSMGVIFLLNFMILSSFFVEPNFKLNLMLVFWCIITCISFFDDFVEVNPKIRLAIQVLIGLLIGLTSIKIGYISNIFGWIINLTGYSFSFWGMEMYTIPLFFTVVWYVLVFNALNWSDGIPWLTSGLSFFSFLTIFLLWLKLYMTDNYEWWVENAKFIMEIAIIILWSLTIFWFFDSRQKFLMGDSGTMFLGFMLATLAIIAGGKIATVVAAFGIYFIDAFYVIFRRIANGKSPFHKDYTHLHHRLQQSGLKNTEILILVYTVSCTFGIASLFLDKVWKILVFFVLIFLVVFLNFFIDKVKGRRKKS